METELLFVAASNVLLGVGLEELGFSVADEGGVAVGVACVSGDGEFGVGGGGLEEGGRVLGEGGLWS